MTEHRDPAATAFERALRRHADDAPPADGLLERVRERGYRLRRNRRIGASLLAAVAVAGIVLLASWLAGGWPERRSEPARPATPEGWRWESSRGVQLLVPDTWGYSWTYSAVCLTGSKRGSAMSMYPYVGRASDSSVLVDREICPRVEDRVPFVWFDDYRAKPGIREHSDGWAEETKPIAGVKVTVFTADDATRRAMIDSLRPVGDIDAYGCPVRHPIAEHPETRPAPGGGLATVGTVTSISVCSYTSHQEPGEDLPPLLASSRLTSTNAQHLVAAILAAPEGSGPNGHPSYQPGTNLESCRKATSPIQWPEGPYGYMKILLIVRGSERDQEVVVRFDGCDFHGTDDGEVQRQLTVDLARTLIALDGPHRPYYGLSHPVAILLYCDSGLRSPPCPSTLKAGAH